MEAASILHTNKGNGATSYAQNSTLQKRIISIAKPVTMKAVEELLAGSLPESMAIADLGCSSGQNTLNVVSDIMDVVYDKYKGNSRALPELSVFLNDLYENDFNNVFVLLPSFRQRITKEKGGEFSERCSIFGAPGSFYGRLFPSKSLHFVHSSSSLHWRSQAPPCLWKGAAKEAMNKGRIYLSKKSPPCVQEAYAEQFREDFLGFLKSRSEETVKGGKMVLSFLGRQNMDPTSDPCYLQWDFLGQALMNMVGEGLIEEERVDSFNAPYYAPCIEQIQMEIDREGSFTLDEDEFFEMDWVVGSIEELPCDSATQSSGKQVAKLIRAVTESMFKSHFGGEMIDELFTSFQSGASSSPESTVEVTVAGKDTVSINPTSSTDSTFIRNAMIFADVGAAATFDQASYVGYLPPLQIKRMESAEGKYRPAKPSEIRRTGLQSEQDGGAVSFH